MAVSEGDLRLEVRKNAWRLAVSVTGAQPEVELSASEIRLQFQDTGSDVAKAVNLAVPLEAQPLDLENAKCSFSRKRSELFIEWPQQSVATKTAPSEAETTASESDGEADANPLAPVAEPAAAAAAVTEVVEPAEPAAAVMEVAEPAAAAASAPVAEPAAAVENAPAPDPDSGKSAEEWRTLGNAAVKSGDLEEGIRCYSAGLLVGGGDEALLCSNRALCYCQLGRNEEGLEDAKRCVALRPDFFKGYVRGAKALRALCRPEEALAFLKKCPKNEEAATLAAELKPEAEAAEAARIASLGGAEKAKEEGNVLFRRGLFEDAALKYSKALEACDDQEAGLALAIRNNRAACYHQLSDYKSVIADTSYVLEREPGNFKALSRRMLAWEPLEKYEAALQDARAVLRQDPRNELANKVQHRLGKLVRDLQRTCNA